MAGHRVVYKFGGTSVAGAARMAGVAELVRAAETPPVVVVSAMGGVTDRLVALCASAGPWDSALGELEAHHLEAAREIAGSDSAATRALEAEVRGVLAGVRTALESGSATTPEERLDRICSAGEDLSARILARALDAAGVGAAFVDARTVVRTDAHFGRARPDHERIRALAAERLIPLLDAGTVPVLQGFVGGTGDGRTTTLGRGGSDYTAALLGAALGAGQVHIWTDVDGILSGDPRTVDHPRILSEIGFEEAVEVSWFGAKVIHPGAAKHAVSLGVPLRIRNTFRPEAPGTLILNERRGRAEIAAVAYKPKVTLIEVRSHASAIAYGFLARVFGVLARHRLPVDLVATSHSSTAFTLDEAEDLEAVAAELSEFSDVEIHPALATVTVVGHGLLEEPGTDALVFWEVGRTPVHLISQASDVSLSFVVDQEVAPDLVRRLHRALIELRDEGARERME